MLGMAWQYGDLGMISSGNLVVEQVGDNTVVRFTDGILDTETVQAVCEDLSRLVQQQGCKSISLDFANVTFLSAAALGRLLNLHKELQAGGGGLRLCNVEDKVYEVFDLTRLADLLNVRPGASHQRPLLVVEDDLATREALKVMLEKKGYSVRCASNGQEALTLLRQGPRPSLILLDLMMAGMDGWQFRRQQNSDPELASIPVIIISAVEESSGRASSPGIVGYLQKPIELDQLLQTVQEHC
jgi:anti-anti-sigma factor